MVSIAIMHQCVSTYTVAHYNDMEKERKKSDVLKEQAEELRAQLEESSHGMEGLKIREWLEHVGTLTPVSELFQQNMHWPWSSSEG